MCSRGTLGIFTTSIKRSWAFSFLRPTAARPLHLTSCLERCTAYPSAVQRVALDSWAVTSLNRFSSLAEAFSRRLCRPSASMMPQSQTSSPPQDPVQWPSINYALWLDPPLLLTRNKPCRALEPSWVWPMTSSTSTTQAMSSFGHALAFMSKPETSCLPPETTGKFTRGTASKLYGIANFLEQGIYGQVGYGGLMAIKARQEEATAVLTPEIEACFEGIEAVMRCEPKREFSVFPLQQHRVLAASDAAVEADNPGSGGFHLIFFQPDGSQTHLSFVAINCAELQTLWQLAETHICLDRTAWPFSKSARPLVPGQCECCDDLSERAL